MPFVAPDQCVGTAACSIFIFKESNIIFFIMPLHEILITAELPMMNVTAACQPGVYLVLCDKILIPHLHTCLLYTSAATPVAGRKFPINIVAVLSTMAKRRHVIGGI